MHGLHQRCLQPRFGKTTLGALCARKNRFCRNCVYTHNARAFDSEFILKELFESSEHGSLSVILSGHNITLLKYGRTKFIDSINYFQLKLSALPARFGLPESAKRGYFPHLFNTLQNEHCIGPQPSAEFYGKGTMSVVIWYYVSGRSWRFSQLAGEYPSRLRIGFSKRDCRIL